jgi:hypothetical protein
VTGWLSRSDNCVGKVNPPPNTVPPPEARLNSARLYPSRTHPSVQRAHSEHSPLFRPLRPTLHRPSTVRRSSGFVHLQRVVTDLTALSKRKSLTLAAAAKPSPSKQGTGQANILWPENRSYHTQSTDAEPHNTCGAKHIDIEPCVSVLLDCSVDPPSLF